MLRTKKDVDKHVRELLNKTKNENDRRSRGYNVARLYFNVGEYENARRYLAEFISFRPKSPEAHKLMGQIYEKLGQKENSVNSYKTSYSISDTQKDLVLKICEIYSELDVDVAVRTHWADEGDRLFPHHNSIVKLKQSLMLTNPSQSKEEMEKFYLGEIKSNPLSLNLHVKLARHYIEWGKEVKEKYDEAFNYVRRVELRRPFPHSLEWYQTIVEVLKAYENWKKPNNDVNFEEMYLTILDRYVFESIASSSGPALSALCTPNEAAQRLKEYDDRLMKAMKFLNKDSDCFKHLTAQYYFHFALLVALISKTESVLHKDIYISCLLLHSTFLPNKLIKPSSGDLDKGEIVKTHQFVQGHYRVSQTGHLLNRISEANRGQQYLKNKTFLLLLRSFFNDKTFLNGDLKFVDEKIQQICDQEVCLSCSHDLRELVWLFLQYSSSLKSSTKFFNFHFFRRIQFSSILTTFAPETLCHLDLVAFIVAAAYCYQANTDSYDDSGTSIPSILAVYLHTPEQGEWWNAVASLCSNTGSKRLNRLRSILQNGLESIRHLGHYNLPLQVTVHLARYFTSCIAEAQDEGNSPSEIEALEERAEHYWRKAVSQIFKSFKGSLATVSKSRLFEIRRSELSESDLNDIGEEGELFIADRLSNKGKNDEAIQILSRLKTPKAAFNRAMLYKKQAQSLLGNRTWHSLNLNARNEYTSLLTQTRDALYLTLDRLKMPGVDLSNPLNHLLSDELTFIEHALATVTVDEESDNEAEESEMFNNSNLPQNLTNGNGSIMGSWSTQPLTINNAMFSTPSSERRIQRQEARPSPERLDAQVRHLTEIQQNTIKNIEEHNAALRAQNEALLQTCQTMAAEFKENVAFYKSYIEQKSSSLDHMNPVLDQMKQLQAAIKNLQIDVRNISTEINELKIMRTPQTKTDPLHLVTAGTTSADNQVPIDISSPAIQGVYNNYMGFYGQQPVGSPLVAPTALFNACQPPFIPPSTLQEQAYLPTASVAIKSETPTSGLGAAAMYQPGALGLKLSQNKVDKEMGASANPPPHSYQITLPASSSIAFPSMSNSFPITVSSEPAFNTEGLLSNIPAPLYSAITTYHSPEKGSKNLLASSLTSTPVTHKDNITADKSFSPTFGQWPNSGADFPGAPSQSSAVQIPTVDSKSSPNKSANDSDTYIDDGRDPCPDFKPIIPLPEQVEVNTGEEDEKILYEDRAKLFRFVDKEWKERGLGPLKILFNEAQKTVRVLMRREQTHKICCNHLITPTMDLTMKDSDKVWLWAAHDFADEKLVLEKFCCKFKTAESAQNFQKAFYKGKMIVEAAENSRKETTLVKPQEEKLSTTTTSASLKQLHELFKPDPGSWSCPTCLVKNKKDDKSCPACQTLKPGETVVPSSVSITKETPKTAFKFGVQTSTSSPPTSIGLTFLGGDQSSAKTGLTFGTPVSKPVIPFGISSSIASSPSVSVTFSTGSASTTFGPSSSVTINPVKPGSSPSISLFKTSDSQSPTAIVISADALEENLSKSEGIAGGKFSLEGFTFSSEPKFSLPKPETIAESKKPADKTSEPKKESIFSNFTFSSTKPSSESGSQSTFVFNLPVNTTTSATIASKAQDLSVTSTTTTAGGLFWSNNKNMENTVSFGALAATSENKLSFTTKDPKAFEPKAVFGKSSTSDSKGKLNESGAADTSKDEGADEYEPQVDFKPVIPMPDLVDVKTGEEDEETLFCERAKLFRFNVNEWKERGVGDVKILKNNSTNKIRLLMRRDQIHKVCANHFITKGMTLTPMASSDKAWVWGAHDFADEEMKVEKFAIRFKTSELAQKFKTTFENAQENLPEKSDDNIYESKPSIEEQGKDETKDTRPLSELFKPSKGSWECSVCLVLNPPEKSSCLACKTLKDGSGTETTSTTSTGSFSFGISQAASTSTNTEGNSGFKFGITSTSTPTTSSSSAATTVTTSTTTTQPFTFIWAPPSTCADTATTSSSSLTFTTPSKTSTPTNVSGTQTKGSSTGFTFGSPGKYEFAFSGVKSPRSRDTSTCESENGAEEGEEEEDNLYFEPVIPMPEKVPIITGEEEEEPLFVHRAKLFRLREKEFKERGLGDVKLLQHKITGKIRVLMRREQIHKICLNHYLTPDMQFRPKDDKSLFWVATDFSEQEPSKETFAIRFKTSDIMKSFLKAVQEAQIKLGKAPEKTTSESSTVTTTITTTTTGEKATAFGVFGKTVVTSIPKATFSFGDRSSSQTKTDEPSSAPATPEQVEKAKKLLLPDNFYLYEEKEPCKGCIGCSPEDFVFKKIEKVKEELTPSSVKTNLFGGISKLETSTIFSPKTAVGAVSPISGSKSIFGGVSATSSPNIFGIKSFSSENANTSQENATNIFGSSGTKSSFTGEIFGGNTPTSKGSIFGGNTFASGSIFGGSPSSPSIFGGIKTTGSNDTPQSTSIFGGIKTTGSKDTPPSGSIFGGIKTTSSNDTPPSASIFGGIKTTSSNDSIFGGIKTTSSDDTTPSASIFGGIKPISSNDTPPSASIFGGIKTTSPDDTTISSKPDTTTNIFGGSSSTTTSTSPLFVFLSGTTGSVLSFEDLAKQKSDLAFTKSSSPKDSSAWVSTPVFASATKKDKNSSVEGEAADDDYDPHYEPVIPMPELVQVTTGEEGWNEIFSQRAKVFRFDVPTKQWKERGTGEFKIQHEPNLNKYRFLQRREQVLKLSCNHYITHTLTLDPMQSSEKAWCWTATDFSENSEGEILKLAVRFKTKEIAMDFKSAFDSCMEKILASPPPSASVEDKKDTSPTSLPTNVGQFGKSEEKQQVTEDDDDDGDEYEDISGSEETVEEEEDEYVEDETDDEELTILFSNKCQLSLKTDEEWKDLGSCDLKIVYDDDVYGTRIICTTEDGEKPVNSFITIQTYCYNVDDLTLTWTLVEESEDEPPKKIEMKASFESEEIVASFIKAFEEGKDCAYNAGIEDSCRNEVPKELLYYGQASEGRDHQL
ncbi:E3 SUMO-protein ligase RanBP2, partial [Armadillidium nasatum]